MSRISVVFYSAKSGNYWTKSYRSKMTAKKAVKGIVKKTMSMPITVDKGYSTMNENKPIYHKSRGFKYKSYLRNLYK